MTRCHALPRSWPGDTQAVAAPRPSVPAATKRALVREAGGKCANPGCAGARVHLHHIQAWAVYQTHDGEHMIALCPTCHDAAHGGTLRLDDDTLYRWKQLHRSGARSGHIYVAPGD